MDEGISVNLITLDVFNALGGSLADIKRVANPLAGIGESLVHPVGVVELDIEFGGLDRSPERIEFIPGPRRRCKACSRW